MSLTTTLSPSDRLAFLPHPRTPPSYLSPLPTTTCPASPYPSKYRAGASGGGSVPQPLQYGSRSAPTSPQYRGTIGLTGLNGMTPMMLGPDEPIVQGGRTMQGGGMKRKGSGGERGSRKAYPLPSQPVEHPSLRQLPVISPRFFRTSTTTRRWSPPFSTRRPSTLPRAGPSTSSHSRSRARQIASSSSETETEVDSDSTAVPNRLGRSTRIRHKQSLSQPDLVALRDWAGEVASQQVQKRRSREAKSGKTPLRSSMAMASASAPSVIASTVHDSRSSATSTRAESSSSLVSVSIPPKTPHQAFFPTPGLSSSSDESPAPTIGRSAPLGGMTFSEDADDDLDGMSTDSPSSGSLSSPKRRINGLRHRMPTPKGSLGLTFEPEPPVPPRRDTPEALPNLIERRLQRSSLLSLRLLAVIPSIWGICVSTQALWTGGIWEDVWPWGVDSSREALERLIAGDVWEVGRWRKVDRGDMVLCIAWAMCTAHFCFSLTTGLTHRWRSYYSLPSTLTRLLSLQCLCWPATYLTLYILTARRPLLAWIVIGVTTGWSRTIQMWVTSNVSPGEITPKAKRARFGLGGSGSSSSNGIVAGKPEGMGWWDEFTWGRKWDWDDVAKEVGWEVGGLLILTCAWLFWGIETERFVEMT